MLDRIIVTIMISRLAKIENIARKIVTSDKFDHTFQKSEVSMMMMAVTTIFFGNI